MLSVQAHQLVRIRGEGVSGRIVVRRQARCLDQPGSGDEPQFRDFGPVRLIDDAGQYAVEVAEGGRTYWVFARAFELEAA